VGVDSDRRSDPSKDVKFKICYKKSSCPDVKFDVSSTGKNVALRVYEKRMLTKMFGYKVENMTMLVKTV
jgi:hypothetical protein